MSYIYNAVKNAIGGVNVNSGMAKQKDWSPNNIRSIYIMRDFVLVAYYTKLPKLVMLDSNEVGLDLQNPNRIGSLNNLLSNRQLSCMEEIYVDSILQVYPNVIDLQKYVNSLISGSSRLRYYAYVEGLNGDDLAKTYQKVKIDGVMDFTLAKNVGGFRYQDTENTDWYKKYNLRPQYYSLDESGKELATIFNKCKKLELEKEKALYDQKVFSEKYRTWPEKAYYDMQQYKYLVLLGNFLRKVQEIEPNARELPRVQQMFKQACKFKKVPGLSLENLRAVSDSMSGSPKKNIIDAVSVYKNLGILSDGDYDESEVNKSFGSKGGEGFLFVLQKLDTIAWELQNSAAKSNIAKMMRLRVAGIVDQPMNICVGSRIGKSERKLQDVDPMEETIAYINFIMGYCGWNLDFYKSYLRGC